MQNELSLNNFIILEMNSFLLLKDNYLLIKNCILSFSIPKIFIVLYIEEWRLRLTLINMLKK